MDARTDWMKHNTSPGGEQTESFRRYMAGSVLGGGMQ